MKKFINNLWILSLCIAMYSLVMLMRNSGDSVWLFLLLLNTFFALFNSPIANK